MEEHLKSAKEQVSKFYRNRKQHVHKAARIVIFGAVMYRLGDKHGFGKVRVDNMNIIESLDTGIKYVMVTATNGSWAQFDYKTLVNECSC
jgi:hypothetical protein